MCCVMWCDVCMCDGMCCVMWCDVCMCACVMGCDVVCAF